MVALGIAVQPWSDDAPADLTAATRVLEASDAQTVSQDFPDGSSATVTRCPYKGVTTGWWSAGDLGDVAWSYGAPTAALAAITGLVAFDDTRVEVTVDL